MNQSHLPFKRVKGQGYLKVICRSNFRSRSLEGQLKFKVIQKANSKVTQRSARGQGQISRSRSLEGQFKVKFQGHLKVKVQGQG